MLAFLFFWFQASAQSPGQKSFALLEDNRPLTINCIFKSASGFIYVGTNTGLFSFDGANFTKLYFRNKDYHDTVTAIAQDASHTIWAGFKSGRLARLLNKELTYYDPEEGTPAKKITAICFDNNNELWYASYGEGIYHRKNNRHYLLNADNGIQDLNINSLCKTSTGEMLAASDQGLIICPVTTSGAKVRMITPAQGLPDYIVNVIAPASDHQFWIGLQDKGFCLYNHQQQKIIAISAAATWAYGEVNDLLQDGDDLWIATQTNGLLKYEIATGITRQMSFTSSNDIHQVISDPQGNIWFSDHRHNLVSIKGNNLSIYPYGIAGLYEKIHAVLFDSRGNIWTGEDQGIYQFSFNGNKPVSKRVAIPVDFATDISAFYEDPYGNIWIGTMGRGVFMLDPRSNKLTHIADPAVGNNTVLSISGKGTSVYICSLEGPVSVQLPSQSPGDPGRYQISAINSIKDATHFVYSIFKDSKNRLWYATDGDGLWMEDTNGHITEFGERDGLKDSHIYSVTEDRKGNIWCSSASAGVYKYDGKNFTNFGLQQGISDLYISVVKTLGSGNIAVVNRNGVDLIDPVSGRISYLSAKDGIGNINANNLGAVSIDDKGRLLVAGEKGILAYDVKPSSSQYPQTLLLGIHLFAKEVDTMRTVFSHDENNFTFNFVGLYFTDPAAVYYQYKMEGLDTNWINTMDRSQTFPKLGPGKYIFRVRSSLNKNFSNASEAAYHFTIRRAFYNTWWFISICALLLASILYAIIRFREQQIRKMQQLQHEKMAFQFEVLRNQVNPHFLFNSFNTLISTIEENPKLAVEYTEQLSDFFRNIVSYRDKDTIVLGEELELLNTYFFLQRKRYGDPLQLKINISEAQKQLFRIPPLTLQLLVENAIKHNAVSKDIPLSIQIDIAGDELTVFNKKNKRNILQAGVGLGLQNIRNRFSLLTHRQVIIENTPNYFLIKLPLVPNDPT
jgi:ligand-binding sensor domain-containing protein